MVAALVTLVHRPERRGICRTLALTFTNASRLHLLDTVVKLISAFTIQLLGENTSDDRHEVGQAGDHLCFGVLAAEPLSHRSREMGDHVLGGRYSTADGLLVPCIVPPR